MAGRTEMSDEGQALCFMSGASSIFAGDKLLTTPNPDINQDMKLFDILGIQPKEPFVDGEQPTTKESYKSAYRQEATSNGIDPIILLNAMKRLKKNHRRQENYSLNKSSTRSNR